MTSLAMASLAQDTAGGPNATPQRGHQRVKSSVFKGFMHRRNNSDGAALPASLSIPTAAATFTPQPLPRDPRMATTPASPSLPNFSRPADGALGELRQNQQDPRARSRPDTREERPTKNSAERGRSPVKGAFGTLSFKSVAGRDGSKLSKSREPSPTKPKKTKSSTNLTGLLSRPRSTKNLHKLATDDAIRDAKDKENRTPVNSSAVDLASMPTPIFAQFSSQPILGSYEQDAPRYQEERPVAQVLEMSSPKKQKDRPKSYHAGILSTRGKAPAGPPPPPKHNPGKDSLADRMTAKTQRGIKGASAIAGLGQKPKSAMGDVTEEQIDPKDIDKHLEAMLDRRNIPENQRYKMRNLNDTIKMEFIRQDWAEMRSAKTQERPGTNDSNSSLEIAPSPAFAALGSTPAASSDREDTGSAAAKTKRSRGRSFTLGRGGNKDAPGSPTKKAKGESTLGRHFRSKSTDSVASVKLDAAATGAGGSSAPSSPGLLAKIKMHHGPGDFVGYLRKVPKPELVEVGKLHKLRLLLRNETVAWTEQFIQLGGMMEIVGLLNRILEVEWR